MNKNELDLIINHLDNLQDAHYAVRKDIKELDAYIREHMRREEQVTEKIHIRLSSLEWKAHGFAVIFGALGALLIAKVKTIFGIDQDA
jgi:hypothetical protein